MNFFYKIITRIVEEVHKSRIDGLEGQIVEMEKDHRVMKKTINDSEKRIKDLESKLYNVTMLSAKMEGIIQTTLFLKEHHSTNRQLSQGNDNEH